MYTCWQIMIFCEFYRLVGMWCTKTSDIMMWYISMPREMVRKHATALCYIVKTVLLWKLCYSTVLYFTATALCSQTLLHITAVLWNITAIAPGLQHLLCALYCATTTALCLVLCYSAALCYNTALCSQTLLHIPAILCNITVLYIAPRLRHCTVLQHSTVLCTVLQHTVQCYIDHAI